MTWKTRVWHRSYKVEDSSSRCIYYLSFQHSHTCHGDSFSFCQGSFGRHHEDPPYVSGTTIHTYIHSKQGGCCSYCIITCGCIGRCGVGWVCCRNSSPRSTTNLHYPLSIHQASSACKRSRRLADARRRCRAISSKDAKPPAMLLFGGETRAVRGRRG